MASADPVAADPSDPTTFPALAERLLLGHGLRVGEARYRLVEIEIYTWAPGHRDPFAHRHPAQMTQGGWYFHRQGRSYRGGTFKGLDLTFGPLDVPAGILIRTLRAPDGALVNGSCTCVEHLLQATGHPTVASLDAALPGRVDDPEGPMQLVPLSGPGRVLATARVGLTLARMAEHPAMGQFFGLPYRYLTDPTVGRGKPQTILALHEAGRSVDEIRQLASSTRSAVQRTIEAYERGRAGGLAPWEGVRSRPSQWAEIYGAWSATSATS